MRGANLLLLLLFFGLLALSLTGCGIAEKTDRAERVPIETAPKEEPLAVQMPQYTPAQAPAPTQPREPARAHIPGIAAADIKLNLEKLGMQFTGPRPFVDGTGYLDDGTLTDPGTGLILSCTITAVTPVVITAVTFRVEGAQLAGRISTDTIKTVAQSFLGFCATLPYDGAEPDKARAWVEKYVVKVEVGKPVSTTFGNVKYELAGDSYLKILQMVPVAP